jgi:hypothetical protein
VLPLRAFLHQIKWEYWGRQQRRPAMIQKGIHLVAAGSAFQELRESPRPLRLPLACQRSCVKLEFRSRPERSCDASSQKGAGDALVASCGSDYAAAGKNATGASLSPCGDEASPLLSAGRFGIRV